LFHVAIPPTSSTDSPSAVDHTMPRDVAGCWRSGHRVTHLARGAASNDGGYLSVRCYLALRDQTDEFVDLVVETTAAPVRAVVGRFRISIRTTWGKDAHTVSYLRPSKPQTSAVNAVGAGGSTPVALAARISRAVAHLTSDSVRSGSLPADGRLGVVCVTPETTARNPRAFGTTLPVRQASSSP